MKLNLEEEKHGKSINFRLKRALEYRSIGLNQFGIERKLTWLLDSAEKRAKRFNIPYDLDIWWATSRYTGHCEISGLPFEPYSPGHGRSLYALSLDQIKPRGGYTKNNCRFIIWGLNAMLGNKGTIEDILKISKATIEKHSIKSIV